MPFVDTHALNVIERKPGWRGRFFDSATMSFVHYDFDAGASIHRHHHDNEEVWHVVDGELDITIGDDTRRAGAGDVAIVPANVEHEVVAVRSGRAIIVDSPRRPIPHGV